MYYYLVVIVRRREKFCNSVGRRGNEKSSFSSSHLELSNAEMRFSADSHIGRVVGCVIHPPRVFKIAVRETTKKLKKVYHNWKIVSREN